MKTSVSYQVTAIAAALLALSGCHHRSHTTTTTATQPGIVVSQARFVLPAVKGNPGAAYFTLGNEHSAPTTLVGVDIVGVHKTEMHQTSGGTMGPLAQVRIDPGQRVIFAPGGKHVMGFGVTASLSPGGSSEITFHFQDGKAISAPLRVEAPGSGAAAMPGMSMSMGGGGKP